VAKAKASTLLETVVSAFNDSQPSALMVALCCWLLSRFVLS
jgi:hypothetical protein